MSAEHEVVSILDFGSQYTQLIARRVRELGVYSEILPHDARWTRGERSHVKGLILSGGPDSVYRQGAPRPDPGLYELGLPILGICYGMQLVTHLLGGEVAKAARREYGRSNLIIDDGSDLLKGIGSAASSTVWMSHGDRIERMPKGFCSIAHTENSPVAAMKTVESGNRIYCLQFHPEVAHTIEGFRILQNFVYDICRCRPTWSMSSYVETAVRQIREQVGNLSLIHI